MAIVILLFVVFIFFSTVASLKPFSDLCSILEDGSIDLSSDESEDEEDEDDFADVISRITIDNGMEEEEDDITIKSIMTGYKLQQYLAKLKKHQPYHHSKKV